MGADPGAAVVGAAGGERGGVEGVDARGRGLEGEWIASSAAVDEPEDRPGGRPEGDAAVALHHDAVASGASAAS